MKGLSPLLSLGLSLWLVSWVFSQERSRGVVDSLRGTITNESGDAITDAEVLEIVDADSKLSPISFLSEANGQFLLQREPRAAGSIMALVTAAGFESKFLDGDTIRDRNLRVVLQKQATIRVKVVDHNGEPIEGALVAPISKELEYAVFRNKTHSFLQNMESKTDRQGFAHLTGATAENLACVAVRTLNFARQFFVLPETAIKNEIELRLGSKSGILDMFVLDDLGHPVPNALVQILSPGETVNLRTLKAPANGVYLFQRTNEFGKVTFCDIPIDVVDVRVRFENDDGRGLFAHSVAVLEGIRNQKELRLDRAVQKTIAIVDASDSRGHAGIQVTIRATDTSQRQITTAITNEDGMVQFDLTQGEWEYFIDLNSLPPGYYLDSEAESTVKVSLDEDTPLPPIVINRGRMLIGSIKGTDLELSPSGTIEATLQNHHEQRRFVGQLIDKNRFQFILPADIADSEIQEFRASGLPPLSIETRNPWVLSVNARNK